MARIIVNHQTLKNTGDRLDGKVSDIRAKQNTANAYVDGGLHQNWEGMDYNQYRIEWKNDIDNATNTLVKKMEEHANFLRFASKKYQDAQTTAINKAGWIITY